MLKPPEAAPPSYHRRVPHSKASPRCGARLGSETANFPASGLGRDPGRCIRGLREGWRAPSANVRGARHIVADDDATAPALGKRRRPYGKYFSTCAQALSRGRRRLQARSRDSREAAHRYSLKHGLAAAVTGGDQLLLARRWRFRHAALLRARLGGPEARAAVDGADGGKGDAGGQCRDRRGNARRLT